MHINNRSTYEPGELIVRLRKPAVSVQESLSPLGLEVVEKFDFGHQLQSGDGDLVRLKLPEDLSVEEGMKALKERADIAYAEPNYRYYLDSFEESAPNDLDRKLWGLHNTGQTRGKPGADISVLEAWKTTVGDRKNGPIVAIIDSGVDTSHPDLVDNLWVNRGEIPDDGIDNDGNGVVDDIHGYNAYHDNVDLSDGKVHGTHVAGTVGATGNNGIGITGVAQEAQLMTIKIFGDVGHTNQATVLRGLAYADRMGVRITTNSWGGIYSKAMEEAYASSPALHIASAGNSGRDNDLKPHYPGSYPIDNMIAVAATDHKDELGSFSSYGAQTVHVAAPGEKIYSTLPGNRYKSFGGTSMACPHVGGVASLILTEFPEASNEEVKNRLLFSSDPLRELDDVTVSGGRLNAARSLQVDDIAPAKPSEFKAVAEGQEVTLKWDDLHDDGEVGEARSALLSRDGGEPRRVPHGASQFTESFPLSTSPRVVNYELRAADEVGNLSKPATTEVTVPAAATHFKDEANTAWEIEGAWAANDVDGTKVWEDSPDGKYGNRTRAVLTSPTFDLTEADGQILRFRSKLELARGDYLRVEASSDGGWWRALDTLDGEADWKEYEYDLGRFRGSNTRLRFIVQSDSVHDGEGVSVSNIAVLGANTSQA